MTSAILMPANSVKTCVTWLNHEISVKLMFCDSYLEIYKSTSKKIVAAFDIFILAKAILKKSLFSINLIYNISNIANIL